MGILRSLLHWDTLRCEFCGEGLGPKKEEECVFEGHILCGACRRDLEVALDEEADRQIEAYLLDLWYESRGLR